MRRLSPVFPLATSLLLLGAGVGGAWAAGESDSFLDAMPAALLPATVAAVLPAGEADLLRVDGGTRSGLRTGSLATVFHGNQAVAELVVISAEAHTSSALILKLFTSQPLRAGDPVRVNVRPAPLPLR